MIIWATARQDLTPCLFKYIAAEFGMINPAAQQVCGFFKKGIDFGSGKTTLRDLSRIGVRKVSDKPLAKDVG